MGKRIIPITGPVVAGKRPTSRRVLTKKAVEILPSGYYVQKLPNQFKNYINLPLNMNLKDLGMFGALPRSRKTENSSERKLAQCRVCDLRLNSILVVVAGGSVVVVVDVVYVRCGELRERVVWRDEGETWNTGKMKEERKIRERMRKREAWAPRDKTKTHGPHEHTK